MANVTGIGLDPTTGQIATIPSGDGIADVAGNEIVAGAGAGGIPSSLALNFTGSTTIGITPTTQFGTSHTLFDVYMRVKLNTTPSGNFYIFAGANGASSNPRIRVSNTGQLRENSIGTSGGYSIANMTVGVHHSIRIKRNGNNIFITLDNNSEELINTESYATVLSTNVPNIGFSSGQIDGSDVTISRFVYFKNTNLGSPIDISLSLGPPYDGNITHYYEFEDNKNINGGAVRNEISSSDDGTAVGPWSTSPGVFVAEG